MQNSLGNIWISLFGNYSSRFFWRYWRSKIRFLRRQAMVEWICRTRRHSSCSMKRIACGCDRAIRRGCGGARTTSDSDSDSSRVQCRRPRRLAVQMTDFWVVRISAAFWWDSHVAETLCDVDGGVSWTRSSSWRSCVSCWRRASFECWKENYWRH